jgi:hypothetical protein
MKPEKARELAVVLIHLAIFSELGVLTRIYLDRFFSGGCSGSFGVCLTSDGTAVSSQDESTAYDGSRRVGKESAEYTLLS